MLSKQIIAKMAVQRQLAMHQSRPMTQSALMMSVQTRHFQASFFGNLFGKKEESKTDLGKAPKIKVETKKVSADEVLKKINNQKRMRKVKRVQPTDSEVNTKNERKRNIRANAKASNEISSKDLKDKVK